MISMGLLNAEKQALLRLLVTNHLIHTRIQVLDLSHNVLADISDQFLTGQVNVDTSAEITRSLEAEFIDPYRQLGMDTGSPDDGALFADRMLRVVVTVLDPTASVSTDIPVFTGPVSKVDRDGVAIKVSCLGKESLSMGALWRGKTYKKGVLTTILSKIMSELSGENKMDIPDKPRRSAGPVALNRASVTWTIAKGIARALSMHLFYDGRGTMRLRNIPSGSVFVFADTDSSLLSLPQATFDSSAVINAVEVIGAKPKKSKKNIRVKVVAPRRHQFSPWNLGRNGVPRFLSETITDDKIRSKSEALSVARKRLKAGLLQGVDVVFDAMPIYPLEELDICRVESEQYVGNFKLQKFSLPLTCYGSMSVGYNKRVTPSMRHVKVRSKHRV